MSKTKFHILFSCVACFVLLFLSASTAQADTLFSVILDGTQEVPPTGSTATGQGSVILNQAETHITVTVNIFSLQGTQTAAHIHRGAFGVNGPVVVGLPNGSFTQTYPVTPTEVADLKQSLFYVNIHSNTFPNGEMRGQIIAVSIPEPANLVSWYRADGSNANDWKGLNNGTLVNGTLFATGIVGTAFSFDGIDDKVQVPNSPSLNITGNQLTLMAWIKLSSSSTGNNQILSMAEGSGAANERKFGLYVSPSRQLGFEVRTTNTRVDTDFGPLPVDSWVHVAGTYNQSVMTWYVNGVAVQTMGITGNIISNSGNLTIGQFAIGGFSPFKGLIDEPQIYNRALTVAEIQAIYNARSGISATGNTFTPTSNPAYLRSTVGAPWGQATNEAAMNDVFGAGNWQDLRYETVNVATLLANNSFIFMEGSNSNATELEAFLNANLPAIETWVNNGGRLFLNSAPNEDNGMNFGFGGTTLNYINCSTCSNSVTASVGASSHPIFNAPFTPVGTSFTGNFFSHATVTGSGLTPLITGTLQGGGTGTVLAEKAFGNGKVLFGGMTTTNFHAPQPNATNLRKNIFAYLGVGGIVTVSPAANLNVTFSNVTTTGNTTAFSMAPVQVPALPPGYSLTANVFDIQTSATYSGNVTVRFNVPAIASASICNNLIAGHFTNNAWDLSGNAVPIYNAQTQICTVSQTASSLSPFAVLQNLNPTAANVTVGGRVTTAQGRGIRNVRVTLTDTNGSLRTAVSGSFGYYRFTEVPVGETYIISVVAKRYTFIQPVRVLLVNEELTDVNFIADEN